MLATSNLGIAGAGKSRLGLYKVPARAGLQSTKFARLFGCFEGRQPCSEFADCDSCTSDGSWPGQRLEKVTSQLVTASSLAHLWLLGRATRLSIRTACVEAATARRAERV